MATWLTLAVQACTNVLVSKGASADGSVITSHTGCCDECRVHVVPAADWPAGTPLPIRLAADWLVCAEICIPERGSLALDIPVGTYKSRLHRATEAMRAVLDADARPQPVRIDSAEVAR